MNAIIPRFAAALALVLSPLAARAQAPVVDSMPDITIVDHIDYYKPSEQPDNWFDNVNPPFTVLPGGDPSFDSSTIVDALDFTSSGRANFLAKVADARGRAFGTLKLNVSASGAFTSVLRIGKQTYPFRGTLDAVGSFRRVLTPRGAMRVAVRVQVAKGRMSAAVTKGSVSLSAQ